MPHGGGHAGHGGFHGGRHRHSGGVRGYGSGGSFGIVLIAIAIVLIILIVPTTVTYRDNSSPLSLVLSPGDTRIVSRASSVCQGVKLSSTSPSVNSTLYLLRNAPKLLATNSFVLPNKVVALARGYYEDWSFHLYPGSKYSLAACLNFGDSVKFYIIKGTSNFNSWIKTPTDSRALLSSILNVNNLCDNFNVTGSLSFTAEDDYYFVFYNFDSAGSSASVQVTFTFDRTEYLPESVGIVDKCTTTAYSSCSLNIPYNSDYTFLIQTTPPTDGDWGANVDVTASCYARGWVYAVIEISMIALVAAGVIMVLAIFCRDRMKRVCAQVTHTSSDPPTTTYTSAPASSTDALLTPPPIGFRDAVLTPPPPPDYANGILAPPPQDNKDALPPDYKDEPPPPY